MKFNNNINNYINEFQLTNTASERDENVIRLSTYKVKLVVFVRFWLRYKEDFLSCLLVGQTNKRLQQQRKKLKWDEIHVR